MTNINKDKKIVVQSIGILSIKHNLGYVQKIINSKGYIVNDKFYSSLAKIKKEYGTFKRFTCDFPLVDIDNPLLNL